MTFANVADNLRESFRVIAGSREPGELRELPGVSIASAGVTFQMFNAAFLSGPVATDAQLAQRITVPEVHFNARGMEWAYWVCEDWIDSAGPRPLAPPFERHGLRHSVDLPGMAAEHMLPPVKAAARRSTSGASAAAPSATPSAISAPSASMCR